MSVVIISAESYCQAEEIAEAVAQKLEYECIGPEILTETSQRYRIPEDKLEEVFRDSPSLLDKISNTRTRNLAYFQAVLTAALNRDNVVYCGEAGHQFVSEVSHILTVRLTADLEERETRRAEKEGIPEKKARELLLKENEQRQKWFQSVLGVAGIESGRFDLVINVTQVGAKRAVKIIAETAQDVKFQPITYSVKAMQDQELASRVRAALIDVYPDVTVSARDGEVSIKAKALKKKEKILSVREEIQSMDGVSYVELGS